VAEMSRLSWMRHRRSARFDSSRARCRWRRGRRPEIIEDMSVGNLVKRAEGPRRHRCLRTGLAPGAHRVQIDWQSDDSATLRTRLPRVNLQVPSSNVTTEVHMQGDRWVLFAGGSGIGPQFCIGVI
jgi:hypothetical protein